MLPPQPPPPPPPPPQQQHDMLPPSWFDGLTGYFVYILLVATLGPLLFGFHLVRYSTQHDTDPPTTNPA
jgi:hypothetical protein